MDVHRSGNIAVVLGDGRQGDTPRCRRGQGQVCGAGAVAPAGLLHLGFRSQSYRAGKDAPHALKGEPAGGNNGRGMTGFLLDFERASKYKMGY